MRLQDVQTVKANEQVWHGTPPYIPYRDLRSIRDADFSSDIYNLGRILHRILTGKQCTIDSQFLDNGGLFGIIIKRSFFEVDPFYHDIEEFIKILKKLKGMKKRHPILIHYYCLSFPHLINFKNIN
jgi:hypothetical protein